MTNPSEYCYYHSISSLTLLQIHLIIDAIAKSLIDWLKQHSDGFATVLMIRWCGNSRIKMDKRKRHLDAFAIANPSDHCHNQSIWSLILLQIRLISKRYCLSIQFDWKKQISDSRNLSHFNKILENSCNKIFFYNLGLILVAQNDTPNVLTKQRTLANRNREKPIDWN